MSLIVSSKSPKKSSKGCWTCKRRKIGCDRSLPHCQNCARTCRICEGYGIKLHWPEAGDGRRPACAWEADMGNSMKFCQRSGDYHFLNTTCDDLDFMRSRELDFRYRGSPSLGNYQSMMKLSRSLANGFETSLQPKDSTLLSYYNLVLSRMITTIDDSLNGFRTVLLPNALSEQTLSSRSLRQAILALSAFHLCGHELAVKHKLSAIRLLSQSIQSGEDDLIGQFATCMMLCVCDVFDSADGSWYTHLSAAKVISSQLYDQKQNNHFLDTWLAYHDVLACFSQRPSLLDSEIIFPKIPSHTTDSTFIIGSLGCSLQVLQSISCVNDLSRLIELNITKTLPLEYSTYPTILLETLETLHQRLGIIEDKNSGHLDKIRIYRTAELYRLAALIYLHRSVLLAPSSQITDLVSSSLDIIDKIGICTSPWPLFITACEVSSDDQRVQVLNALETMQRERRIGNVDIMRGIIERVWKRRDLGSEGDWREVVGLSGRIPSFI